MRWEELTSSDLREAAREAGVCVLAMGVIEKHGEHLPLGTDYLNAHKIACLAAEREPAIVFPPFYFGQISEARCFPGTVMLRPALVVEVINGVLDEIARNGIPKIIIYSAHGGNSAMLRFLAVSTLYEKKAYELYLHDKAVDGDERKRALAEALDTDGGAHAGEAETSLVWAGYPELVRPDRIPPAPGDPLGRLRHLPGGTTNLNWYSNYPEHYAGDARTASREKGLAYLELLVDSLAEYIAAVKADEVLPALREEFFRRERALREPSE